MFALLGVVAPAVIVYDLSAVHGPGSTALAAISTVACVLALVCIAGLTVEATRRRRISQALSRRKQMLELLQAVSVATNGSITDRSALHLALRAVCSKLGWSAGIVYLLDEDRDLSVSTSIYDGTDPALIDLLATHEHQPSSSDPCPVRLAMATRRPVCSEDDQTGCHPGREAPVGVAVPIVAGGEVVGALEFVIDTPRPFRFSSDLRDTLATVGIQLGRVVERARHHQHVQATKDAEEQRRVAAERSNAAKSEFLAAMSHELRTPLNAVLGFTQLLEEEQLPGQQSELVGYIARSGRHVLELVNGLLDISRIEAGHLDLSLADISLAARVAEATSTISTQSSDRDIEIDTAVAEDLYVHADAQRLFQVLLNLLSNAVKYNRAGGTVTVTAAATSEDTVRVTVEDTGVGIAPELLPRLFQPFDRLGASDVQGTGLGLALSRHLVEAMGGSIGVSSTVDVGTRFWIDLPRSRRELDAIRIEPMPGERDHSGGSTNRAGRRGPGPPIRPTLRRTDPSPAGTE